MHMWYIVWTNILQVCCFCKNKKIATDFEENWKEKVYDRRYIAVVQGEMKKETASSSHGLKMTICTSPIQADSTTEVNLQ